MQCVDRPSGAALGRVHDDDLRRIDAALQNPWSRELFIALWRRYELKPYRYRRQRHTTLNVKAPRSFIDKTLWPEFLALDRELTKHLDKITTRIIKSPIHRDTGDVDEIAGALPPGAGDSSGGGSQ